MGGHRTKIIYSLIVLLVIFACILLVALANLIRKNPLLGIGMDYYIEDSLVIVFSLLAMIKVIYEIHTIDNKKS